MALLSNLNEIAQAFRGVRTPHGIKFRCPCHEDSSPSCTAWYGERAIMVKCFAGCPNESIIEVLRDRGFVTSVPKHEKPPLVSKDRKANDDRMRDMAVRLWNEAKPLRGSLAERYIIEVRWLRLDDVDVEQALRFHPACPRGHSERVPTLIGAFRHIDSDEFRAIQRIFLTPEGRKDGKPMMLGPVSEAAIKLTSHRVTFKNGRCDLLHVCEGIESGIGAIMLGFKPQWVLGSTSGIRGFRPRPGISEICICADNDPPGIEAAQECIRNWTAAGRKAQGVMPA